MPTRTETKNKKKKSKKSRPATATATAPKKSRPATATATAPKKEYNNNLVVVFAVLAVVMPVAVTAILLGYARTATGGWAPLGVW